MIPSFVLGASVLAFILGSYEDLKKREVYDYINFSLVFFILMIAIFDSVMNNNLSSIVYVVLGSLIGFFFGSLLYYIGMWGGGDAKFLIGFGAASYYLLEFINFNNGILIFSRIVDILKGGIFTQFLQISLYFVLVLDVLILLWILVKGIRERKKVYYLLFMIFAFIVASLTAVSGTLPSLIFSFLAFVLVFFADDKAFDILSFNLNKKIKSLKEDDVLSSDICYNDYVLVSAKEKKNGLSEHDISFIKNHKNSEEKVSLTYVFPVLLILILNFLAIMFREVFSRGEKSFQVLFFNMEFLFISFITGGIFSIGFILYSLWKNRKEIKISFPWYEKLLVLATVLLSIFVDKVVGIFLILAVIFYIIIRISKPVEKFAFVGKKKINDLVLGDWIVQDIIINGETYFKEKDFRIGVDEDQMSQLKELSKNYEGFDSVYVKDGIAFLPPLFMAFLIMLFIL